jgi:hypothetical protein
MAARESSDRFGLVRLLGLCAILLATEARAAGQVVEVRPFLSEGWLRAEIQARDILDERTRSTIQSGLPGTCIYQLNLEDRAGRVVAERYIELTLRFDLWENFYILDDIEGAHTFPTLAAADSALSHRPDCGISAITSLQSDVEYRIIVRIAVRPLAAEDRRRLSRYVSRTSGGGHEEVAIDLSGVFQHILGDEGKTRPLIEKVGPLFRLGEIRGTP